MSKNYTQNGEYELVKLQINLPDGNSLDLRDAFIEVSIYETMMLNMSGTVAFLDTEGAYSKYFLGQNEEIEIVWSTAGSNNKITYKGIVYKAETPERVSEHSSGIVLHFTSKEYMKNLSKNIERPFSLEVSKIVESIYNDIKNYKKIEATTSKGIFDIIGTGQKPIDFINQISRYAVSNKNEYGYLFYEDNKNFVFKPLQELLSQQPETQYYYKNAGVFSNINKKEEESFNAIQDYEFVEIANTIDLSENGLLGATSENLNLLEKTITTNTYSEDEEFKASKSLGKFPEFSKNIFPKNYQSYTEGTVSYVENSFLKYRFNNYMEMFKTEKFAANIVVFGDTNNKVGIVIKCDLPVWGKDVNRDSVENFSGNCLVFEVKHILKKTGYTQVMKLIKDSYEKGGAYEQ